MEIRVAAPAIRESKKSLRADACRRKSGPVQHRPIMLRISDFKRRILDYRASIPGICLGSSKERSRSLASRDESFRRRDNKQGDGEKKNHKPGRKFLHTSARFPSFLHFPPARNSMRRAHCDSVGYVYVRAAFESRETKPLSVPALPRAT